MKTQVTLNFSITDEVCLGLMRDLKIADPELEVVQIIFPSKENDIKIKRVATFERGRTL